MIVQPMRPAESATTKFWFGMPASGASAWASSRPPADSMRTSEAFKPALAQRHPGERLGGGRRGRVSITGPQIVDSTASVSDCSPFTSIVSVSRSSVRGPSGVR